MNEIIKQKIVEAYKKLLKYDFYLLKVAANERSIAHKFAEYIQTEFLDYNVDAEYNRTEAEPKKLEHVVDELKKKLEEESIEYVSLDDEDATTVFPDIIVHRRGTKENLLVIEAKKDIKNDKIDSQKLLAYKTQLGYRYAYSVTFPTKQPSYALEDSQIAGYITEV